MEHIIKEVVHEDRTCEFCQYQSDCGGLYYAGGIHYPACADGDYKDLFDEDRYFDNITMEQMDDALKYKHMWNDLKQYLNQHIDLVANWCGGCEVCERIKEPHIEMDVRDILKYMENEEEK